MPAMSRRTVSAVVCAPPLMGFAPESTAPSTNSRTSSPPHWSIVPRPVTVPATRIVLLPVPQPNAPSTTNVAPASTCVDIVADPTSAPLPTRSVPADTSTASNADAPGPAMIKVPTPCLSSASKPFNAPSCAMPAMLVSSVSAAGARIDRAEQGRVVVHDEGVVPVAERERACAGVQDAGDVEPVVAVAERTVRAQRAACGDGDRLRGVVAGECERNRAAGGRLDRAVDVECRRAAHVDRCGRQGTVDVERAAGDRRAAAEGERSGQRRDARALLAAATQRPATRAPSSVIALALSRTTRSPAACAPPCTDEARPSVAQSRRAT